jgi:hypothetical protein
MYMAPSLRAQERFAKRMEFAPNHLDATSGFSGQ